MSTITRYALVAAAVVVAASAFSADTVIAKPANDLKCKGCVGKKDIAKKAVTKKAIRKGNVTPKHLATTAKPTGVDFVELPAPTGDATVNASGQRVATVSMKVPGPGYVVVNADFVGFSQIADRILTCALTHDDADVGIEFNSNAPTADYRPVAFTRTLEVPKAGTYKVSLDCRTKSGEMLVRSTTLTGMFVPNRY